MIKINYKNKFKLVNGPDLYLQAIIDSLPKLPNDICKIIYNKAFPEWCMCRCSNNNTCYLCRHACCYKAQAVFCVCLLCMKCPDHGFKCHGTHD